MASNRDYLNLDELEQRTNIPKGSLYHKTRLNKIPGQTRIGRRVLVHWPTFERSLQKGMVSA
jgi:predicted DNA-binding transcriptional regulator AlpA